MAGIIASAKRQEQERLLARSLSPASLFGRSISAVLAPRELISSQRILRKTFWEAVEQRPFTYQPLDHVSHCFDALLQVSHLLS